MGEPSPLFVFGVARSGTNLLARMLDAHPLICVALDPLMPLFKLWRNLTVAHVAPADVVRAFDPASSFQDYYFSGIGPALLDLVLAAPSDQSVSRNAMEDIRVATCDRAALESPALAQRFADWHATDIGGLVGAAFAILRAHFESLGKTDVAFVGVKEVWTFEFALPLACAIPRARFVAIHRDPRAVIGSLTTMMRADPSQAAHTVSYMRHWRKHVAVAQRLRAAPELAGRMLALRFEDLAAAPEEQGRRLANFLGLPFTELMLRPGGGTWSGNSSFGRLRAAIDGDARERWRDHLSPAMTETVEFYCGPEMRLLGYPCGDESDAPSENVVRETLAADRAPGKWRSDSGDPLADLAWETLRRQLLARGPGDWPEEMVRRCFLFWDVYAELRASQERGI